jgi:hypothetical protein
MLDAIDALDHDAPEQDGQLLARAVLAQTYSSSGLKTMTEP